MIAIASSTVPAQLAATRLRRDIAADAGFEVVVQVIAAIPRQALRLASKGVKMRRA
jgi:hypothetical protein